MPYIKQEERGKWEEVLKELNRIIFNIPRENREGELNYLITSILNKAYPAKKYSDYNSAIGLLECIKQEFYRRTVVPYEEVKIKENGDVR